MRLNQFFGYWEKNCTYICSPCRKCFAFSDDYIFIHHCSCDSIYFQRNVVKNPRVVIFVFEPHTPQSSDNKHSPTAPSDRSAMQSCALVSPSLPMMVKKYPLLVAPVPVPVLWVIVYLVTQGWMPHAPISVTAPSQSTSPSRLLQFLDLDWVPPSHFAVHSDQSLHGPHPPCTGWCE